MRKVNARREAKPAPAVASAGADAPPPSESRFRALFNTVPVAIFACDRDALVQDYNERAAEIWGRSPQRDEPEGAAPQRLVLSLPDGTGSPLAPDPINYVIRSGEPVANAEVLIERLDGSRLPVVVSIRALKNAAGTISGAIISAVDIAPLKRTEQALKHANQHRDDFLAVLAHELRNPLSPIRNAVQLMQLHGPAASDAPWALDVIDRQTRQLARLVDDLMDVSRIARHQLEICTARVPLADVLRSAIEASQSLIEERRHTLKVSAPHDEINLNADPTRVARALSNLLDNAAKYSEPGGQISLEVERQTNAVLLKVRDNGAGIPASRLPHIFDMFAQADRSLERSHSGLGLNLSLAQGLITLHGGTLSAHSDGPGRGSVFTVRLPLAALAIKEPSPSVQTSKQSKNRTRRILLVDDNRLAAMSLSILLKQRGHELRLAYDGEEAVFAAAEFHPDVVVLDIGLPKMNGYEAARKIRQESRGKPIVLIALTGWGQPEDRQRAHDAGFDHHLVKPVDEATLTNLLGSLDTSQTEPN